MRNKGAIILLTIIVTLLCIYYLSFTFVSRNVQKQAVEYATGQNDVVDLSKKQSYLDSVWTEPVYNLFGLEYTYQEVKDSELSLGLDLQGGMHVTLEVSPVDILKGLSGNSQDPQFLEALNKAKELQKSRQDNFSNLFYEAFADINSDRKLREIFANAANREKISFTSTDDEVKKVIDDEIEDAIDRSEIILRTRIDQFGTSQPNIQRLQGSGRIQIEIPGADNPERVRKLLQGVAKLEFLEVADLQEINSSLVSINSLLVEEKKNKEAAKSLASEISTDSASAEEDLQDVEEVVEAGESLEDVLVSNEDSIQDSLKENLANQLDQGADSTSSDLDSLANSQVSPLFALNKGRFGLAYTLRDTSKINRILKREDVKALLTRSITPLWAVKTDADYSSSGEDVLALYFVRSPRGGKAPLTGEVITDARQEYDGGKIVVDMRMNATGAKKWKKLTGENVNRSIAVVLDRLVYSAPNVNEEIPSGRSQISGNFTVEEAKDLANILKAGALPAPTRIVEEAIIGPTLGEVAQRQGIISIIAGLVIVVLFMVAYYSKGGLVANIALLFNIFFILGILAQFNAALTLPGIAGIVLTIGMSIDANVLIFERIREEMRNGIKLRMAISEGYDKAFSSIVDANLTTFLTALILYTLGQGPVKGFAITLMIGIVCSFFSAIFITRLIVEWMTKKGDESKVSFKTPLSGGMLSNLKFDFIGKRKTAYMASGAFIIVGIILIASFKLNLGVDFKGGRSYVVTFNDPMVPSELKTKLSDKFEDAGTEVKTYGANNVIKITTSYRVDDESAEADTKVQEALIAGLSEVTGQEYIMDDSKVDPTHFTISSSSKVGATIADDIKNASQQSVIFSLIVIFFYILVRFRRWQFGLGAIIALFHDTLVVLSAFAIAKLFGISYEIDQVFIAAMLTIIGYSINDTVVVFDRVREFLNLGTSSNEFKTFNNAINSTMNRTLITSVTTLIVVLVLFLFGGEVLRGFSFALLVGVLVGTYSSIFIATPVVIDLDKKALRSAKESEAKKEKPKAEMA